MISLEVALRTNAWAACGSSKQQRCDGNGAININCRDTFDSDTSRVVLRWMDRAITLTVSCYWCLQNDGDGRVVDGGVVARE